MKRIALYVRVSTQEQKLHGLSVDSQIEALRSWCLERGFSVVGVYNDAGISARKKYTARPALLSLLEDCKEGLVDLVIFTKLDRWFRSVADYYEVQAVLDSCGVPWRAIWEDYETETSSGVFKVNIMLSVAQAEADRTSERIRAVFDYKRQQGQYVGQAPFGYRRENKKLVKDEAAAPYIDLLFKTYLATGSPMKTKAAVTAAGFPLCLSVVNKILRSETYAGNAYGCECEPYISRETFAAVQAMKKRRDTPRSAKYDYLFTGICFCGYCGARMHAACQVNRYKGRELPVLFYRCSGRDNVVGHSSAVCMSERKIETYLLQNLAGILDGYNLEIESRAAGASNDEKIKKLEARLSRVGLRFEDGDISAAEYKEKRADIKSQIAELSSVAPARPVVLPASWQDIYAQLDREHKRMFWRSVISEIVVTNETKTHPKIKIECRSISL